MFSFFKKSKGTEQGMQKSEAKQHDLFSVADMVTDYVESGFSEMVNSVQPRLFWDAAGIRDGAEVYYTFFKNDEKKVVKVPSSRLSQFLSNFDTVSIAVPSDRCSTALVSWFENEAKTEGEVIRGVIPYSFESCEFASERIRNVNGYITNIVTSFSDSVKTSFEEAMNLFFASGGAVLSVCDRVFPLSYFISSVRQSEPGKTMMGIERRGDVYFVWHTVNLDGKTVPVNSHQVRVAEVHPEDDVFRTCSFLVNELMRIHKFPPPERAVFIDGGGDSLNTPQRPVVINAIKNAVSSMEDNIVIVETPDAALFGMAGIKGGKTE